MKSEFVINGMTCESCVEKIQSLLKSNSEIISVDLNLGSKVLAIHSPRAITLNELNQTLEPLKKYKAVENNNSKKSYLALVKTYYPLLLIFGFSFLIPLAVLLLKQQSLMHWMPQATGSALIAISFFKFLDIKKFAEGFSTYDPIAKNISFYGLVYPFLELVLGLFFLSGIFIKLSAIAVILILGFTTVGVYQALMEKRSIQCACLGTIFNLPLTKITIFENMVMILMSIGMLL